MATETRTKAEFGDFQTRQSLARDVSLLIRRTGFSPASVIEPTCGCGTFLLAALETLPDVTHLLGVDRDAAYVQQAKAATNRLAQGKHVQIIRSDFFETDWLPLVARRLAEQQLVRFTNGAHEQLLFTEDSGQYRAKPGAGADKQAGQQRRAPDGASRSN